MLDDSQVHDAERTRTWRTMTEWIGHPLVPVRIAQHVRERRNP